MEAFVTVLVLGQKPASIVRDINPLDTDFLHDVRL
jgi:hypothetical protein